MHDDIESYCVTQAISGRDASFFEKGGKHYAAFKLESFMFQRQVVVISNEWFMLYVHDRFTRKINSMLIKAGIPRDDISSREDPLCTKIYVIQSPDRFVPCLMKFEKILEAKNQQT